MSGMATVLPFTPRVSAEAIVRDGMIEMLEGVLARVKAGEVQAVAVLLALPEQSIATDWRGWSGHLLAPAAVMTARLVDDVRTGCE